MTQHNVRTRDFKGIFKARGITTHRTIMNFVMLRRKDGRQPPRSHQSYTKLKISPGSTRFDK